MTLGTVILFCIAVIGITNIIVDPATIFQLVRDWVVKEESKPIFKKIDIFLRGYPSRFFVWLDKLMSCYQCSGFWVGLLCGAILISYNPFYVFVCGGAGSFISTWAAIYLNYLETKSVIIDG